MGTASALTSISGHPNLYRDGSIVRLYRGLGPQATALPAASWAPTQAASHTQATAAVAMEGKRRPGRIVIETWQPAAGTAAFLCHLRSSLPVRVISAVSLSRSRKKNRRERHVDDVIVGIDKTVYHAEGVGGV